MSSDQEFLINRADVENETINNRNIADTEVTQGEEAAPINKLPQYVAAIAASLSALSAGVVLGWTSPISMDIENGMYNHISVNSYQMGWIGSFTTIGAFCFSLITGKICDVIGRKTALILLIIPYGIGWTLILWARSLIMLYFGRCITGMAAGACSIAAPLYINEIAQKEIRGTLGSYFQLMVTVGVLYAYCFGKILSITNYTIMCSVVSVVFALLLVWQPETPLYYLKTNQYDKATSALQQLGRSGNSLELEIRVMENSLSTNTNEHTGLLSRRALKAMFISLALMFFQQFGGVNAIIFYTSDIFNQTHIKLDPKFASIIVAFVQVLATFMSSLIIDKAGRRILLIGSTSVMSICCLALGIFFTLKYRTNISDNTMNILGFLPVLSLSVYIIAFSFGLGPIPWIVPSEILPSNIKGIGTSICGSFNWFLAFLITKFYLDFEILLGQDSLFYIFSVISLISLIFVYFKLPETKGKSLEEIQNALD